MDEFLTCCFPSARKRKEHDEYQLTPLGPDTTRRDMMNTKLKQNLARPRPSAGGPPPPKPLTNPYAHPTSRAPQGLFVDDVDPVKQAEVDARSLFAQAGLAPPDFGYASSNPMKMPMPPPARLPVERAKFEHPRAAPAPPPPPSSSSSTRRDYDRGSTTKSLSLALSRDSGYSATSSSPASKGKSKARLSSELHPAVRNDQWYRQRLAPPPTAPRTSHHRSSSNSRPRSDDAASRPGKLSAFLGLKESEKERERRVQAERERERQARLAKETMAAKVQRGREREREREYWTRKAMEEIAREEEEVPRSRQSEAGPSAPRPQRPRDRRRA